MVLREIREGRRIEFDASHAVLHDGMARDFHGHGASSGVPDFGEDFLDVDRLRRRVGCGEFFVRNDIFDRSNQPAALCGVLEDVADQAGRGCFSVCACDAYALQREVGMLIKSAADIGHGGACVCNDNDWARAVGNLFFGNHSGSSLFCGLLDKGGAIRVFARQRKEQASRGGLSRVEAKR